MADREKSPVRLCWATLPDGKRAGRHMFVFIANSEYADYPFFIPGGGCARPAQELRDIVWLTPEYLDEFPPK